MKQVIIATIALFILWGCENQVKKELSTESNNTTKQSLSDFEQYIASLNQIPLPLTHNPLTKLPKLSKSYDKNGFEKYKHTTTSQPLGVYYQDDKTIGIIDCSIGDWGLVPFLTTYDLNGNKIDSIGFYKKTGQDMGYEAIEHLTLNKDRSITITDTVKQWELNKDQSDILEGTMKITTGKIKYQVLKNGEIEKTAPKNNSPSI